jgi:lipoprotein-anchoring transpeptidase ErfK/SrfK
MTRLRRLPSTARIALLTVLTAVVLTACGGADPTVEATPADDVTTTAVDEAGPAVDATPDLEATPDEPTTADTAPEPGPAGAVVARPDHPVTVHTAPDGDPLTTLEPRTPLGSARALLVTGQRDDWLEIQLPIRPNGATGWIPAEGIELRTVTLEIAIDLDARTLTLTDDGDVVLTTPVAIGTPDTPTPTGRYYLTDKIDTGDPAGPYGPYALGLSAHSDVLDQFAGGPGQIGIHGTDEPGSIGTPASAGCIRVPNDTITAITDLVPLGTPVEIA